MATHVNIEAFSVERPDGHITASTTECLEQAWASAVGPATTRVGARRPASVTEAADASASKAPEGASDASNYDSVPLRLWAWDMPQDAEKSRRTAFGLVVEHRMHGSMADAQIHLA